MFHFDKLVCFEGRHNDGTVRRHYDVTVRRHKTLSVSHHYIVFIHSDVTMKKSFLNDMWYQRHSNISMFTMMRAFTRYNGLLCIRHSEVLCIRHNEVLCKRHSGVLSLCQNGMILLSQRHLAWLSQL